MEDAIPRNRTGQIVALADKLDTLRGCFRVGLIPPVRAIRSRCGARRRAW
jgi:glycyl-tRNA synthetase beta subunit